MLPHADKLTVQITSYKLRHKADNYYETLRNELVMTNEQQNIVKVLINPFTTGDEVKVPYGRSQNDRTIHVHSTTEHYAYEQLAFDGSTIEIIPGELVYATGKAKWNKVVLTERIICMNDKVPTYREISI